MPGPRGDDVRLKWDAQQQHVPDDIENLVTNELVFEPQRLLGNDFVATNDNGAIQRTTANLPKLQQLFDVLVDRERPGRRDLGLIDLGIDRERKVLRVDPTIVGGGAGDLQRVARKCDDR